MPTRILVIPKIAEKETKISPTGMRENRNGIVRANVAATELAGKDESVGK